MFDGEYASLKAIEDTETIKVPHPIAVLADPDQTTGAMLVMEHLDLKHGSDQGQLGYQLARLHLDNIQKGQTGDPSFVNKFGFAIKTCCGSIPQSNTWNDNWTVI